MVAAISAPIPITSETTSRLAPPTNSDRNFKTVLQRISAYAVHSRDTGIGSGASMGPTRKYVAIALVAIFAIASCARGDYAKISISYPAQEPSASDPWPRSDVSLRQNVSKSFWKVAEANGYKCRAHVKRVEEITCRGPKDMHVTFKPTLNRPEFVATFNWVELGDRSVDEFRSHIEKFSASMVSTVNDKTVRLAITQP